MMGSTPLRKNYAFFIRNLWISVLNDLDQVIPGTFPPFGYELGG